MNIAQNEIKCQQEKKQSLQKAFNKANNPIIVSIRNAVQQRPAAYVPAQRSGKPRIPRANDRFKAAKKAEIAAADKAGKDQLIKHALIPLQRLSPEGEEIADLVIDAMVVGKTMSHAYIQTRVDASSTTITGVYKLFERLGLVEIDQRFEMVNQFSPGALALDPYIRNELMKFIPALRNVICVGMLVVGSIQTELFECKNKSVVLFNKLNSGSEKNCLEKDDYEEKRFYTVHLAPADPGIYVDNKLRLAANEAEIDRIMAKYRGITPKKPALRPVVGSSRVVNIGLKGACCYFQSLDIDGRKKYLKGQLGTYSLDDNGTPIPISSWYQRKLTCPHACPCS